ncbi:DUF1992 domain-containing protein [Agromyces sp. MMS24-K17]|uniref:DnaJ family domain-containing protein n=1 Tax=Agromyces sp. MMS24-K17 TaxID=3372850 RepID=UPI003754D7A0
MSPEPTGREPTGREPTGRAGEPTAADRASYVEILVQQAIRRGDFDDLPGAGKPLEGLGGTDPDWWIRRKIEREQLTGLGPPALLLRVEAAGLDDRLDGMHREQDVRDALADFNARVVAARRQLLGGPPVVTPTRDVDAEVAAWRDRRDARTRALAEEGARRRAAEEAERRRRRWWRRG